MTEFNIITVVTMDPLKIVLIAQGLLLLFLTKGVDSILQGAPVQGNDYPFMVIIRKELNESAPMDVCSGIIINKEWILTLAVCIHVNFFNNPLEARIYLGNNKKSLQTIALIKAVVYHPDYILNSFPRNNLALLHLQTPLVLTETIKSIQFYSGTIETNSKCSVSGWGSLTIVPLTMEESLHYDNMTVLDQKECKFKWSPYVTDANLCTEYEEGRGLTYGDMGGALVMQGKLIGVAGFADVSGMQMPDVYWRIRTYKNWIHGIVGNT